jgi:hypothetical protein
MDNIIYTSDDNAIGFYKDLVKAMKEETKKSVESGEYEQAQYNCECLQEIEKYKDYDGLLVLSENNGMGFTCKKYKEGE